MPGQRDLEFALAEADKRRGSIVELPFGSDGVGTYLITVSVSDEPLWSMYQGESVSAEPLWRHPSRDVALIHSLVFQSAPDDAVNATLQPGTATPSGGNNPVALASPDNAKASLSGKLENVQLPAVLQSVQMSKMTGRLHLLDKGSGAQIYFVEGNPVHANTAESVGDTGIIEMLSWETGDFRFFPDERSEERTVRRRLDSLLMEGVTLLDQNKYLSSVGLKPESFLVRKDSQITQEEFKNRLSKGAPLDLNMQKAFYELIDNRSRLQDIVQRRGIPKVEWIPILFNFLTCNIAGIADVSPAAGKSSALPSIELDRAMILGVLRSLMRQETGMYTFPAFQYFLEQEFAKSSALGTPLSLVIFEARLAGEIPSPLPIPALREVAARLDSIRRPFDILAHYETFDFAVILPGAPLRSARAFANRASEILNAAPLIQGTPIRLLCAAGISSCPDDTQELGRLLAAAKLARTKAKESGQLVKAFSELEAKG